ncbi:MAG: BamA/TamA family outer membrane protein, partial [Vicinamibacteria bacterium]
HIFTGSLIGDYRDSLLRPTRGSLWSVTLQAAPEALGSDLKLVQVFGQLYTYVTLSESRRIVWAGGYRVGLGTSFGEDLDAKYGFRAGGPNSVRGFEQGALGPVDPLLLVPLGGTGLLVFNQEIRFPLFWKFGGVGFYDAGNAFRKVPDIRLSDLRQNVGAGLRFELAFGLIRLDWARVLDTRENESPWRFVFSIGHAF